MRQQRASHFVIADYLSIVTVGCTNLSTPALDDARDIMATHNVQCFDALNQTSHVTLTVQVADVLHNVHRSVQSVTARGDRLEAPVRT